MTNEEKAQEISEKYKTYNVDCSSLDCYLSALEMAKWKERQMIVKACEWLKEYGGVYWDDYDLSTDVLVNDFKQAMEGQL